MARVDDERLRRWTEGTLLAGIVAVPVVFLPAANDAFGLPKLLTATFVAVVGWAAWAAQRRPTWPRFGPVERAVAAYVGVVAVATVTSIGRVDSLFGSYERYGGLLPLLVHVAFGALLVVAFRGRPDRQALVPPAVTVAATAVAAYVLLQTAGIDFVQWQEASGADVRYQAGSMGNSDFAGGLLGIAVPFAVVTAVRMQGRRRWVAAVATAVIVVGLVATRSRGGLAAALVGLGVLAFLERRRIPRRVRLASLLGVVAVVAVVALRPGPVEQSGLLRTASFEVRAREWAGAVEVFLERPILGTGPDTFEFVFPKHRSREDGAELGLQIADKPHSILLEKASDTGMLGLATYLAVLVAALRVARRRPTETAVFVAGLGAYVAQGAVSIDVPPLALLGWVTIAGIVAAAVPPPARPDKRTPRPATGRIAVAAGVAAALVVGLVAIAAADLAAHDRQWKTAVSRNRVQPFYRFGAAFAAERQGAEAKDAGLRSAAFTEARRRYGEVLDMQPRSVFAMLGMARVETLARRFPEADTWWKRAAAADPNDWEVHNSYGLMLNSWANANRGDRAIRGRAAEQLEAALRVKPDHVPALVNLAKIRAALGDASGAQAAAERALRLDPDNAEAKALAGRQ